MGDVRPHSYPNRHWCPNRERYLQSDTTRQLGAGATAPLPNDNIGKLTDTRAGLVVLRVRYSGGSQGVPTVSCTLVGTPPAVFEGVTATKGNVDYWNREAPVPGVDTGNRTNFHVISEDSQDSQD